VIRIDTRELGSLRRRLDVLSMRPQERRRLLGATAKKLRTSNRRRLTHQREVDGAPFVPGKRKMANGRDGTRKVLRGLKNDMRLRYDDDMAKIDFAGISAMLAAKHQRGFVGQGSAAANARAQAARGVRGTDPATRAQIRALQRLGYRVRTERGQRIPSQRWLAENMNTGRAGVIIRALKREGDRPRTWDIPVPARPFFGISREDRRQVQTDLLTGIRRARARRR